MLGNLFGSGSSNIGDGQLAAAQNMAMLDAKIAQANAYASAHGVTKAVSREAGQYSGLNIRVSKAENGFIVSIEGKQFIAESVEDVTGIITVQMIAMEA